MKKEKNANGYARLRIGSNIRKWRNIKEIKQKDLAVALRLSEAAISNIENDLTDITLSQIEDISVTLDVPVEYLFTDPQETLSEVSYASSNAETKNQFVMDKELLYTLIGSIQKKDEQLKDVVQQVMYTMKAINSPSNTFKNI